MYLQQRKAEYNRTCIKLYSLKRLPLTECQRPVCTVLHLHRTLTKSRTTKRKMTILLYPYSVQPVIALQPLRVTRIKFLLVISPLNETLRSGD